MPDEVEQERRDGHGEQHEPCRNGIAHTGGEEEHGQHADEGEQEGQHARAPEVERVDCLECERQHGGLPALVRRQQQGVQRAAHGKAQVGGELVEAALFLPLHEDGGSEDEKQHQEDWCCIAQLCRPQEDAVEPVRRERRACKQGERAHEREREERAGLFPRCAQGNDQPRCFLHDVRLNTRPPRPSA